MREWSRACFSQEKELAKEEISASIFASGEKSGTMKIRITPPKKEEYEDDVYLEIPEYEPSSDPPIKPIGPRRPAKQPLHNNSEMECFNTKFRVRVYTDHDNLISDSQAREY